MAWEEKSLYRKVQPGMKVCWLGTTWKHLFPLRRADFTRGASHEPAGRGMKGRDKILSLGLPFGCLWFWKLVSARRWRFGEEAALQKYSATLSLHPSCRGFSRPFGDRNRSWRSELSLSKTGWPQLLQPCVFWTWRRNKIPVKVGTDSRCKFKCSRKQLIPPCSRHVSFVPTSPSSNLVINPASNARTSLLLFYLHFMSMLGTSVPFFSLRLQNDLPAGGDGVKMYLARYRGCLPFASVLFVLQT